MFLPVRCLPFIYTELRGREIVCCVMNFCSELGLWRLVPRNEIVYSCVFPGIEFMGTEVLRPTLRGWVTVLFECVDTYWSAVVSRLTVGWRDGSCWKTWFTMHREGKRGVISLFIASNIHWTFRVRCNGRRWWTFSSLPWIWTRGFIQYRERRAGWSLYVMKFRFIRNTKRRFLWLLISR